MKNSNKNCLLKKRFNETEYLTFSVPYPITIRRSNLITEKRHLPRGWRVSFDIKPLGIASGYRSIIHATIGKNAARHGDRTPGVWFLSGSTRIIVCTSLNGKSNKCRRTKALPLNQYSKLTLTQVQSPTDYKYLFQMFINGKQIFSLVNRTPRVFRNVKYYAGDPWYKPANALIKNMKIVTYKHNSKWLLWLSLIHDLYTKLSSLIKNILEKLH